jgi:ABC-type Fe3+/spermidine/putrescine transport system ATPase subunit
LRRACVRGEVARADQSVREAAAGFRRLPTRFHSERAMAHVLQLSGVSKVYGHVRALDGLTLAVPGNAYVAVLGPSGSGKTTLLRVVAGFEEPDGGSVVLDGRRLDGTPAHRRGIGFVFQNFALFPHLSVEANVAFGLKNREAGAVADPAAVREKVRAMIALVGLSGLEGRGVHQISGGQRQRVALARTLVTEPRLVLLDEPLGALDANLRARMRSELRAIRERLGVTFLHVTGSETEALAMGDTVVVLDRGRIAQVADADTVYNRPASPRVARFLNCYNVFEESGRAARAVRHDRIEVRPIEAPAGAGEERLEATFVASEYTGASTISLFALDDGRVVEVEAHLSHRAPPDYTPNGRYGLVFPREAALDFA